MHPAKPVQRLYWKQDNLGGGRYSTNPQRYEVKNKDQANLVGSLTDHKNMHMPAIDLDFPARLVPSSTPGHFHLYLEKEMDENDYIGLLRDLQSHGIIEKDFLKCSERDRQSFLRIRPDKHPPDVVKEMDSELLIKKAQAISDDFANLAHYISSCRQDDNFIKEQMERIIEQVQAQKILLNEAL